MLTFEIRLPDPENDALQWQWEIGEAWSAWEQYCCEERGGRWWMADVEALEDGGYVSLYCAHCPANINDLCPDGQELICGEVDGIPVRDGQARSLIEYQAPVSARLIETCYPATPDHATEWDVWIEVKSKKAVV